MRIVKSYERDGRTELVSRTFDELLVSGLHLPFDKIEFHIRDTTVSTIEGDKAMVCIDYNNPFVTSMDRKGIRILILHELIRLMFKFDIPKDIEDVIIGREMLKHGLGEDLCYMYYNYLLQSETKTRDDYIRANLPWIIFLKDDKYNSELFKKLAAKVCKKKFQECKRLFDILADLSMKSLPEAVKVYNNLSG